MLEKKALNIRKNVLKIANTSKGPHIGTALSCVDILTQLYFKTLNINSFDDENRDIFIMSKGHGAMAVYGTLYEKGEGVEKDLSKASQLYKKACDGGVTEGCYNLGVFYENGIGLTQNFSKSKA